MFLYACCPAVFAGVYTPINPPSSQLKSVHGVGLGVGSGSAVGVGSGSAVGVGSGSAVGVGSGSAVGVGSGSAVGVGSGCGSIQYPI